MRKGLNRVFLLGIGILILGITTGFALVTKNISINGTANIVDTWESLLRE